MNLFITEDKRRNKRNLLQCVNSTFKLCVTCRGLSIKCEKCVLFTTIVSRYLTTLKFNEIKERKTCHRNIKQSNIRIRARFI